MMKFRLLSGDQVMTDVRRNGDGKVIAETNRIVTAGAVIESEQDLCAIFNRVGTRPKFERLHEGSTVAGHVWNPQVEPLDSFVQRMQGAQAPRVEAPPSYLPQGEVAPRPPTQQFSPAQPDLSGSTTAQASRLTEAQLQVMGINHLRAHCETEEIPFDGGDSREKLVQVIRAFQGN